MEAITDREVMIQLDSNIKQLRDSIEKFAKSLENLEETRIKELEIRVDKLEKWKNEWSGGLKILLIISVILSLISTFKAFM